MVFLSFLNPGNNLKKALRHGAVVIDVRPPYLYDQGKVPYSLNIPIDQIAKNTGYIIRLGKPVIFCGSRSEGAIAKRILQQAGFKAAYNGGSWERVLRLVNSI